MVISPSVSSVYTCVILHILDLKDGGDDMATLSKLLVGIDVNNPDPDMFQFALDICDSYDATMVLAAFIAPIDINIMSDSYFPEAELDFVDSIIKEEEAKIRKYFSSLIDQHGGAVEIETLISVNDPVVGLSETAEKIEATAIVLSYDIDRQSFLLKSSSVGNRLINTTKVPVIVVPKLYKQRLSENNCLLLTDDLMKEGMDVVESGVNFSSIFGFDKIVHCHIIHNNTLIDTMINKIIDFLKLDNNPEEVIVQQQKVYERVIKDLEMRWDAISERDDVEYSPLVKMGDILTMMEDVVLDCDPGMIVFGRHKAVHFEEAILGHITFTKMMTFKRAICIIP